MGSLRVQVLMFSQWKSGLGLVSLMASEPQLSDAGRPGAVRCGVPIEGLPPARLARGRRQVLLDISLVDVGRGAKNKF